MKIQFTQTRKKQQQGLATLAITLILLLVATIATMMVARVGLFEQKVAGTDVRSKEVYSAAIGGLEYAVNWFGFNDGQNLTGLPWTDSDGDGVSCAGDTASPGAFANTALNADTYQHQITYTLKNCLDDSPIVVTATSLATAVNDSHITKTVSVEVMLGTVTDSPFQDGAAGGADPSVFQGPPVMVEGCMSGVTGNPDIYPNVDLGVAIGTTKGTVGCLDEGHFGLNGGTKKALSPQMSLAQAVFGVVVTTYTDEQDKYEKEEAQVRATLLQLEAKNPDRVLVVDNEYPRFPDDQPSWNGNNWHASLGTEDEPVIIYFDQEVGCPKVNGGPTIWGLIYFADKDCGTHGWGGGEIHGTVALRGDMTSHTANTEIFGKSVDFGAGGGDVGDGDGTTIDEPGGLFDELRFAEIPGSWRDFEP